MLTLLLGAAAGYLLAQGTTRTTILNWLRSETPVAVAELQQLRAAAAAKP